MDISFRDVVVGDADALAHILITSNEASFRGVVPDRVLKSTEAESALNWRRTLSRGLPVHDVMILALTAGETVGYVWGGPHQRDALYRGELKQLMVLPSFWRRGIGRALVRQVVTHLAEDGIGSLRVEVLKLNPNRSFYKRLGGRLVSEHLHDWDGFVSPMYVYGWKDTRGLRDG